jgi:hypothetical protein
MRQGFLLHATLVLAFSAVQGIASADPLDLHRNDGVRIVFQKDVRSDVNEPGDPIMVRVEKDQGLPRGTTLEGLITRIHPANRYRAASADMIFDTMTLPDGRRIHIDAVPTPLNDPHLTRGVDGRLIAAYKPGEEGAYVLGGTVGGLIVGGIGHRPILGAFVGSLIGAIAGASNRQANANLVVRRNEKMVAVFEEDVAATATMQGPPPGYGWRHREGNRFRHQPGTNVPPPTDSGPSLDIRVDGQPLTFANAKPYEAGAVVMVPVETVASQLNLSATIHDNGTLSIDGPDSSVQLSQDSTAVQGSGSHEPLAHKVEMHDGVVYVPLEVFHRFSSAAMTVNGSPVSF